VSESAHADKINLKKLQVKPAPFGVVGAYGVLLNGVPIGRVEKIMQARGLRGVPTRGRGKDPMDTVWGVALKDAKEEDGIGYETRRDAIKALVTKYKRRKTEQG
jgi:hypothetical protein